MSRYRVAALQMLSTADVERNLGIAARLVAAAAHEGAMLAVLPEAFACADAERALELGQAEREVDGPLRSFLADSARTHGIYLVGGTIPIGIDPDRATATSLLHGPDGQLLARYDKIHLFDVDLPDAQQTYRESARTAPGHAVITATLPFGGLGLAVCYDLRFPELFRVQAQRGMAAFALPSAFTRFTGEAHWLPLLRARAIENQCYAIAPNHGGRANERRENYGGSAIIDPWGRVLAAASTGEAVVCADIDLELLADVRRRMPVETHRRLAIPDPS